MTSDQGVPISVDQFDKLFSGQISSYHFDLVLHTFTFAAQVIGAANVLYKYRVELRQVQSFSYRLPARDSPSVLDEPDTWFEFSEIGAERLLTPSGEFWKVGATISERGELEIICGQILITEWEFP